MSLGVPENPIDIWGESNLIQICGNFEEFPENSNALFGLVMK